MSFFPPLVYEVAVPLAYWIQRNLTTHFDPHINPWRSIICTFEVWKLRHRDARELAQKHTAKSCGQYSHTGSRVWRARALTNSHNACHKHTVNTAKIKICQWLLPSCYPLANYILNWLDFWSIPPAIFTRYCHCVILRLWKIDRCMKHIESQEIQVGIESSESIMWWEIFCLHQWLIYNN